MLTRIRLTQLIRIKRTKRHRLFSEKMSDLYQQSLEYHRVEPHGKFSIEPTKPMKTQKDLSLAYSPGVAQPCLEIAKDASMAYEYTNKGKVLNRMSHKL